MKRMQKTQVPPKQKRRKFWPSLLTEDNLKLFISTGGKVQPWHPKETKESKSQYDENRIKLERYLKSREVRLVNPKRYPYMIELQCTECNGEWNATFASGGRLAHGSTCCPHCPK